MSIPLPLNALRQREGIVLYRADQQIDQLWPFLFGKFDGQGPALNDKRTYIEILELYRVDRKIRRDP